MTSWHIGCSVDNTNCNRYFFILKRIGFRSNKHVHCITIIDWVHKKKESNTKIIRPTYCMSLWELSQQILASLATGNEFYLLISARWNGILPAHHPKIGLGRWSHGNAPLVRGSLVAESRWTVGPRLRKTGMGIDKSKENNEIISKENCPNIPDFDEWGHPQSGGFINVVKRNSTHSP